MRISDWSSDVCSSDLADAGVPQLRKMPRDQAADDRPAEQLFGARNRQALRQQLGAGRLPPLADLVPVLHCLSPIVFSRARAAWAPSTMSATRLAAGGMSSIRPATWPA